MCNACYIGVLRRCLCIFADFTCTFPLNITISPIKCHTTPVKEWCLLKHIFAPPQTSLSSCGSWPGMKPTMASPSAPSEATLTSLVMLSSLQMDSLLCLELGMAPSAFGTFPGKCRELEVKPPLLTWILWWLWCPTTLGQTECWKCIRDYKLINKSLIVVSLVCGTLFKSSSNGCLS